MNLSGLPKSAQSFDCCLCYQQIRRYWSLECQPGLVKCYADFKSGWEKFCSQVDDCLFPEEKQKSPPTQCNRMCQTTAIEFAKVASDQGSSYEPPSPTLSSVSTETDACPVSSDEECDSDAGDTIPNVRLSISNLHRSSPSNVWSTTLTPQSSPLSEPIPTHATPSDSDSEWEKIETIV